MKPTKTLIILTPAFPKNESETGWLPTQQILIKEIQQQFSDVTLIVLSFFYPYTAMEYSWNGIDVFSFGGMKKRKLNRLLLWLRIWKKLKTICKAHTIIGLLSFWCGECALIGKYFGRRYGIKHYCWVCGQDARKANKMVRYIRPKANELIGISDFVITEFHKNHNIKPTNMIPLAINTNMFAPLSPAKKTIDIMAAGSLIPLKQYDIFVRVVHSLKKVLPNIKALHCGNGDTKADIQTMIKNLGLENTITLLGEQPHSNVLQQMQQAKIFLHPSSYEGFGAVCAEALYAGAHVISFCQPLNQEIEHWYIVKTEAEMFAKAFELLIDPALDYNPILVYEMKDSARAIMQLFQDN